MISVSRRQFWLGLAVIAAVIGIGIGAYFIGQSSGEDLTEAELQQDWIEDLADSADPASRLAETEAFDTYLEENGLRTQLVDPNRRSQAHWRGRTRNREET